MSKGQVLPDPASMSTYADGGAFAARAYRDLCSTCNHAGECGDRSTPERPILFCEQFDAFIPASPSPPAAAVSRRPAGKSSPSRHKGLCVNCESRSTCILPKGEGGIWHCEEYR